MPSSSSWAGLTAQRFAGKPLRQPKYIFRDTPRCEKDLSHSSLYEISSNRDHWNDSMAEMVLLCNEVMRRKRLKEKQNQNQESQSAGLPSKSSKPLSLEYMADRLDVDDPLFGFMIRTNTLPNSEPTSTCSSYSAEQASRFQVGMLQGFITITTFTNWQSSFCWDSLHGSAFAYDEPELAQAMMANPPQRKCDVDGSLAKELQRTVRCGDPYNEGIVWPRIAEISLLGALGCGKALLSLAIERLEAMVASGKHNYDYVVLQATDNSIPFYESMGFVRVGCVTEEQKDKDGDADEDEDIKNNRKDSTAIVSSPVFTVEVQKNGETAADYAKKYDVDVWDIIFLTQFLYPDLAPRSYLMKGTILYIPDKAKMDKRETNAVQWYSCEDNETPRDIAKKFNLRCKDLLSANRGRIEHLLAHSRLIEGTKVQVSNLDQPADHYVPYCHWTFPDDKFENNEPSYMMARKLQRKNRVQARKFRPVEESFVAKVSEYIPENIPAVANATVIAPPPPLPTTTNSAKKKNTKSKSKSSKKKNTKKKKSKKRKRESHPDEPLEPKKPRTAYMTFLHHEIDRLKNKNLPVSLPEMSRITSQRWKAMADDLKEPFIQQIKEEKRKYDDDMKRYKKEWKQFQITHQDWFKSQEEEDDSDDGGGDDGDVDFVGSASGSSSGRLSGFKNLVNKVVKLNGEGRQQVGTEFQYYFVLTYIPDLFWCHLAPMRKVGIHTKKKAAGRTKWMLVDESEGKEIDITGAVCEPIKSRVMKGCEDADKEEWDIIDPEAEAESKAQPKALQPMKSAPPSQIPTGTSSCTVTQSSKDDVVRRYPIGMKEPKHAASGVPSLDRIASTMSDSTTVTKAVTESDLSDRASDWDLMSDADPLFSRKVNDNISAATCATNSSDLVITPLIDERGSTLFEDRFTT